MHALRMSHSLKNLSDILRLQLYRDLSHVLSDITLQPLAPRSPPLVLFAENEWGERDFQRQSDKVGS